MATHQQQHDAWLQQGGLLANALGRGLPPRPCARRVFEGGTQRVRGRGQGAGAVVLPE